MAITVQSVGTGVSATGGTLAISAPSGVAAGDLMFATIYHRGTSPTITMPSGWTQVRTDGGGSGVLNWYAKIAASGDVGVANYTWLSALTTQPQVGLIRRITGADTTDVTALLRGAGAHGSHVAAANPYVSPAATGGNDGDMALRALAGFFATTSSVGIGNWNPSGGGSPEVDPATVTNVYTSGNLLTTGREVLAGGSQPGAVNVQAEKPAGSALGLSQDTETTVILKAAPSTIAPVNTAAPTISLPSATHNPPRQAETITGHIGTWTGTPAPTFAIEFRRDGVTIAGTAVTGVTDPAQTFDYVLTTSDVGVSTPGVVFHVAATNSAGSASADSAAVTPVAQPSLSSSDVLWKYSGGAGNTSGNASLGGGRGAQIPNNVLDNLFDDVARSETATGPLVEWRLIYFENSHPTATAQGMVVFIDTNTPDTDTNIAIGVAVAGVGVDETAVANEHTTPPGVTFTSPAVVGSGVALGDIPPNSYRGLWIQRTVAQNAAAFAGDRFSLTWDAVPA